VPDRKRAVVVRMRAEALGNEQLAPHATHRRQDALVRDPTTSELSLDHLGTRNGGVDGQAHFASVRSPAKRAA